MPKYQLTYFNSAGRAELARWIFAASGQEFEDIRLTKEEWPAKKASTPFGQLPVLTVDGEFHLGQSSAIARFLGKRFGFMGKDDLEEAKVNMVMDCTEDVVQVMIKMMFETDEARKLELKQKWDETQRDELLTKFESLLGKSKSGFFVGDSITVADMAFVNALSHIASQIQNWDKYPNIARVRKLVEEENQGIANWIKTRPVTAM